MAQINKPNLHFNTKLYTGNGSSGHSITGVGFQPDWVWIKNREQSYSHFLTDAVRGVTKEIYSDSNGAEYTRSNGLTAFGADGFTVGDNNGHNQNGNNLASWNWKAGGGQGSSNTDGSINTTYTSVNTTAGFSISTWTGTGANGTIGHGLGAKPEMIIVKNYSASQNWCVYHSGLSGTEGHKTLYLDLNQAEADQTGLWNDTAATSSVFSVGTNTNTNGSSASMIAYAFAEKKGYSKFGSYTGNGNADGTFVYTGFKPAFLMVKKTDSAENWYMKDNKRDPRNEMNQSVLYANGNAVENTGGSWLKGDAVSNGFKIRISDSSSNGSNSPYIYMAFAENPIVGSNNIPATAR